MALTQEQILAALDRAEVETKEVTIPELGGTVIVREMPGNLRNRMEATYATIRNGGDSKALDKITAQIVAVCTVDAGGRPIMTTDLATRIVQKTPKAAFRIRDAALELSATDEDDVEALAEVFDDARSADSSSD
ncbi:hypothetical protein AB0K34_10980 [Actinomadura sp. NPDC049382]|uniref:hypothetical protein n=1 Tax=Actinomadura sp. NPDC049382 TaxID=3158220 RepID=UPI00341CDE70